MTYFNIIFKFGVEKFVKKSAKIGIAGIILPDLPLEEAGEFLRACEKFGDRKTISGIRWVTIGQKVTIKGESGVFPHAIIGKGSLIEDTMVGPYAIVLNTQVNGANIGAGAFIKCVMISFVITIIF
jgi:Tryptophan synthase alpha chain